MDFNGLTVGGCRLHALLGQGGMGTVYRATQQALGREVAVKLVPAEGAEPALVARFKREVRTAAALEHPHSIPIYAAGEEDGLLYLVMRLVHGPDLGALVKQAGPLPPSRAVALLEQVAGALDAAHAAGLVHRDVKPANILVERGEESERAYLSDFGLMRRASGATAITRVDEWVGTVDYVAPEQIAGRPVDGRADVYALAGVLYHALTGRPPFPRASATETARAHQSEPPPRVSGGPAAEKLSAVIARGMAKSPQERYPTAGALAAAARAALGTGSPAAATATARRDYRTRRRRWMPASVLALVALAGGAVGAAVALSGGSSAGHPASSATSSPGTSTASPGAPITYTTLSAGPFTLSYPQGWSVVAREQKTRGNFFHTEILSPDGSQDLIIDRTPGVQATPQQSADSVQAQTAQFDGPYLRQYSFGAQTLGGRSVFEWTFTYEQHPMPQRIDIFENVGTSGYAVLGKGPSLSQIAPIARTVASSLKSS